MPSLVRWVKAATGLPTHALLRPRFGDFLYTGEEFSLLLEDAAALLEAGADAIVSGFLTPEGDLDRQRLAQLLELCHRAGKRFTLHRAFDMFRDPFAALALCKELGVDTVLTSGQKNTCLEGLPLLEELWPRRGGVELGPVCKRGGTQRTECMRVAKRCDYRSWPQYERLKLLLQIGKSEIPSPRTASASASQLWRLGSLMRAAAMRPSASVRRTWQVSPRHPSTSPNASDEGASGAA